MNLKIKTLTLMFLVSMPITAQTSEQLTKKYGSPISETYKVGPDTIAIFKYTYGANDQLCNIIVTLSTESKVQAFDTALENAMIDELAPKDKRGKNIMNGFLNLGDSYGTAQDFENVTIVETTNRDDKARGDYSSIGIAWIKKDCNNKNFWKSFKPPPKITY